MGALHENLLLSSSPEAGRECGDCTACCTVLAQDELRKPMRCACEQIVRGGCRIYSERPKGCREFNCLWLRGALLADVALRPDHLGVVFDAYQPTGSTETRLVALEVWGEAFAGPAARTLIDAIAAERTIELSYRDGRWGTLGG